MPSYLTTILLEFSEDPISDASPAWQDVTSYMRNISWQVGIDREGSEPEPGSMTVVMKNTNRDWEPDYVAGRFYPNVTTQRRFRLTLNGTIQGLWYVQSFDIDYPLQTAYSEVTITCGDGSEILALDNLPTLDPPEASSYAEVVGFDEPWGYWRLGEPQGTRARPNIVGGKHKVLLGHRTFTRKFRQNQGGKQWVSPELGAVAGSAGAYRNKPLLGQPGLVVGDSDTCVLFTAADSQWARVPFEDDELKTDPLTLEAIVNASSAAGTNRYIIGGPSVSGNPAFALQHTAGENFLMGVTDNLGNFNSVTGSTSIVPGTTYHVAGTYDGLTLRIYVDGVEDATPITTPGRGIGSWATNALGIGAFPTPAQFFDGYIDEVAIYERALGAERIAAHATAAFDRGYPEQTAADRVDAIAASPLWNESGILVGTGRNVQPMMQAGQAKLDVISELVHSEGMRTMFYFDGSGNPIHLNYEFAATNANYNTVQWTFGDGPGEVSYQDIGLEYDNETFNDVTASAEGGELVNVTDTTAIDDKGRRANAEWTDTMLADQSDVEALAADVLAFYKDPALRPVTLTINGSKALAQFQDLQLGHLVRVKRRGIGGTAIDRVVSILGKDVSVDENKQLICTYRLSRGFNASLAQWHLGISGFAELGSTTVLA